MPATARTVSRSSSELVPDQFREPGFDGAQLIFDASATVHSRSSSQRVPDEFTSLFSKTLTTSAIEPTPLLVVWTLTLQSESEGPTLISCAAKLQ